MSGENSVAVISKESALQKVASSIGMNTTELKNTLMSTVIKDIKVGDGYRKATEAEFMAVIAVAAAYDLNPLTKEIYAYPDKGGIVPIVSTDGWNKLMTTHPNYLSHSYIYSEDMVTPAGGKECYKWIEIVITKKDGSELRLREYLDECYRKSSYPSPWQTHTKRMLRHKVKIQGAREAFGFGGIYEQDEGQRIIEADITPVVSKSETVIPAEVSTVENNTVEPESTQPEESVAQESGNEVTGLIQGMEVKTGETNKKKWTKYAVSVGNKVYVTFSSTDAQTVTDAHKLDAPVVIVFEETERGRNIKSISIAD